MRREAPETLNLADLPVHWQALDALRVRAHEVSTNWQTMQFTARFIDEGQPAGHRTYFAASQNLSIASDNHDAFVSLIQGYGVTHWAHWNLLRPVLEASFHALWLLDPLESIERRRRGLRLEVLDAKEQDVWLESLVKAGLDRDFEAADAKNRAQAGKVYREEAAAIGLPWKTARMNINLVDELPRLTFLRDTFHSTFGAFMVSVWRQLSGFQHGKQYSLLSASTQGRSLPIPGGQSVYVTISDQISSIFAN